jgi:hypothetical protein
MSRETSNDLIQASRKFFGYALAHDPIELFEQAQRPSPNALGTRITEYLTNGAAERRLITGSNLRQVSLLFAAAINDTRTIITQEMHSRQLKAEHLPLIARDARTVNSIARIAMHSEGFMQTILSPGGNRYRFFHLSEDATHVQVTHNLVDTSTGGCPFAVAADRTIKPDPIFRQTIAMAGDLTFLAYKNKNAR